MQPRKGHVWTASKLEFLTKYLHAFNVVVRKFFPNRIYVDGYAGPGTNLIDGQERDGSPLIALKTEPSFTRLFMVEKHQGNFRQLQSNVNLLHLPPERVQNVTLTRGDFNDEVDGILAALPDHPVFFFLDPEGLELDWETVRKIGRRSRADLFILISAGGVTRCAGSPPTHDRVTRFYGHDRWEPIAEGVHPERPIGQTKFESFINLYLEGLRNLGFNHVQSFLIATNSQQSHLHALVFAAKNPTAIKIAEDILKKIQREQREKQRGASPLFEMD